jgi:hypothetical protein
VEGFEEEVIKGMHFLLESKRVQVLVAEWVARLARASALWPPQPLAAAAR